MGGDRLRRRAQCAQVRRRRGRRLIRRSAPKPLPRRRCGIRSRRACSRTHQADVPSAIATSSGLNVLRSALMASALPADPQGLADLGPPFAPSASRLLRGFSIARLTRARGREPSDTRPTCGSAPTRRWRPYARPGRTPRRRTFRRVGLHTPVRCGRDGEPFWCPPRE